MTHQESLDVLVILTKHEIEVATLRRERDALREALEIAAYKLEDVSEWCKAYAEPKQAESVRIVAEDCREALTKRGEG